MSVSASTQNQEPRKRSETARQEMIRSLSFASGRRAAAVYTHQVESVALDVWRGLEKTTPVEGDLALFALGGFARRELSPHSDLDLLLLYSSRTDTEQLHVFADELRTNIHDAGFRLALISRTIEENLAIIEEEPSAATALVDARLLLATAVAPDLRTLTRDRLRKRGEDRLLDTLAQGMESRHQRFGDSVYLLEPNVKMGRGGLRDVHTVGWAAAVLFDLPALNALIQVPGVVRIEAHRVLEAYDFLMTLRHHLHDESGWKNDRLTFPLQEALAQRMGFYDDHRSLGVERLMGAYYRHAHAIQQRTQRWLERWRLRGVVDVGEPLDVELPLEVRHGRLAAVEKPSRRELGSMAPRLDEVAHEEPAVWAELFRVAADHRLRFYPGFAEHIAYSTRHLPENWHLLPRVARVVLDLFGTCDTPPDLIDDFANLGPFYRALPEFQPVHGWVHHDVYHVYAVDVHSIRCHHVACQLLTDSMPETASWMRNLVKNLKRQHVLLMAALLHDVGKGRGGDHSEIGARLCAEVGLRLENAAPPSGSAPKSRAPQPGASSVIWTAEDTELLCWLVLHHLDLSMASQRRDLSDPETISDIARLVGDTERLDLLVALTIVDGRGVKPDARGGWKETLLLQLYSQTRAMLDTPWKSQQLVNRRKQQLVDLLKREDRNDELGLVELLPERLLTGQPLPVIAAILSALGNARTGQSTEIVPVPTAGTAPDDTGKLAVVTPDQPGLLAELAGALTVLRGTIVRASVYTTDDGMAIDVFEVGDPRFMTQPDFPDHFLQTLADLRAGQISWTETLQRTRGGIAERPVPEVADRIRIQNDISQKSTVVEVRTRDRPGLLATIARTLTDAGLDIKVSLVSTEGVKAVDVFYVTRDGAQLSVDEIKPLQGVLTRMLQEFQAVFRR